MQNKKGFTLVELIVVITIIAILWTIAFISLQWFGWDSRDSKRVSELSQIRTGLQVYQAKEWNLPMPDDAISIWSGSTVFIYQWYAGTGTLNTTRVSEAKDPVDDKYYTYSVDSQRKKYQLMTLLENWENISNTSYIPKTIADYETREPYTIWFQLWSLLETETKTPIQEYWEDIDLSNDTQDYIPVFDRETSWETMSWELIVEKMEKVSEWLDVYDSCEWTEHTKTKNFYSTEQVWYWESCEPNTQTFTCNDWEWYNQEWNLADRETYSYETCSVAWATNCPANETYTYNTNTYNVPEIPHSSSQTITSEEITENNWTFTYTLNMSCDNWEYTEQTETWPDFVSCDNWYENDWNGNCEEILYASCKTILDNNMSTWNGVYTIDPENNWTWFEVYCDMTTDWWGWTRIIKDYNTTISDLSFFGNTNNISSTFYSDVNYWIGWWTNDDIEKYLNININYSNIKIKFSWFYDTPSEWLWKLTIKNENDENTNILYFTDSWTNKDTGQTLSINNNTIYSQSTINEENRKEIINYENSSLISIWMKWHTSEYSYTKRYIWELWVK